MNKNFVSVFFLGLVSYLLSAGISYGAFTYFDGSGKSNGTVSPLADTTSKTAKLKRDPSLPLTESCPLNGAMYTKPEREAWEKRRPLGVMIENSAVVRPQSGLSYADVVYEAVAEGGISRFLAVFYCQDPEIAGPTRSARTYYLDWISEYGDYPLYMHVGGANTPGPANALGQIRTYGWQQFNDYEGLNFGLPILAADPDRNPNTSATEHIKFTMTTKLWNDAATKRGLSNVIVNERTKKETKWDANFVFWKFKDEVAADKRPAAGSAEFALSGASSSYANDYIVKWVYNPTANSYLRFNGGKEHKDTNTNEQLVAKNVVLMFTTLTVADDGYDEENHGSHMLYITKGSGKAKFLIDGVITDGFWKKPTRTDRTEFTDLKGKVISFNRGPIWIEVLPTNQPVTVTP